ncbi:MAG: sigma-54 interaction domain-containing protein [Sphingomonadales bacterium]|jgi:DNA-binding NtrC family response regulator
MELIQVKQRFGIVGNSSMLNNALETAIRVAPTDMNVLILGDSGVGKESFSKIIHQLSGRKHAPFIAVNCGAIPEGTIDSELFGHEKGAFTGATDKRKGYFETVNGGTIFLDEVGELPLGTQARLLRILENGEFIKVGSSVVQKTDVRVVCATNRDLLERSRQGKFREDLYYRLATVPIRVPKLAERREDIPLLFRKFASEFAETHRSGHVELTTEAQQLISQYAWPGNIRQLKNVTEQICVLEDPGTLSAETIAKYLPPAEPSLPVLLGKSEGYGEGLSERDIFYKVLIDLKRDVTDLKKLVFGMLENPSVTPPVSVPVASTSQNTTHLQLPTGIETQPTKPLHPVADSNIIIQSNDENPIEIEHEYVEAVTFPNTDDNLSLEEKELEMIRRALNKSKGRRKKAAEALGISERTLYRKIKQYELE